MKRDARPLLFFSSTLSNLLKGIIEFLTLPLFSITMSFELAPTLIVGVGHGIVAMAPEELPLSVSK